MSAQLEISLPAFVEAERSLTDEQLQAVSRRRGSLLLSAGAGSGKTSVLVERFVRAVIEDGIAPARILAITFTERSAGELAERIRTRFLELRRRELARDTEGAFLGTFHGFAARLLRAHPLPVGLDPDFAILDEALAGRLRLDALRGALADFLAQQGQPAVDLVAAFTADRLRAIVFDVHAQLRSQGHAQPALPMPVLGVDATAGVQGVDATAAQDEDFSQAHREGARACSLLDILLQGFSQRYAAAKRRRGGLDFDDLELFADALLRRHPHLRADWSRRFELLMVDEFQDTNPRQLAILAALQRDNLFTVGDEFQSIYAFRHADVDLFRVRRAQLAAQGAALSLTRNFRSTPPLLAAINAVFVTRFGENHMPLLPGRPEEGGEEVAIELLLTDQRAWNGTSQDIDIAGRLPPASRWRQAEARLLAQRLADIVAAREAAPGDIAVLLRALGDLPLYQSALEERGLPTRASVGSFWGHQQVGDLLAYLRALANPLDEVALYSTLASPLVGLSSDSLAHISRSCPSGHVARGGLPASPYGEVTSTGVPQKGVSRKEVPNEGSRNEGVRHEEVRNEGVWEMLLHAPPDLHDRLDTHQSQLLIAFTQLFAAERAHASQRPIPELLRRALDLTGYQQHILSLPHGSRRLANVHKLLRLAARHEAQEGRDLRGFLDHVDHQLDALDRAEPLAPVSDEQDAIRLMTIHAAKGLEFPIVALADLGRRPGLNRSDLLLDGSRIGLRLAQLDGSPGVPTLAYEELLAERRLAEAHEEQRILYVALTRARQRLLLSGGLDFGSWPADLPGAAPIAWLAPALAPDLPALARESQQAIHQLDIHGAPGVRLRAFFNTPSALGSVLRPESLCPAPPPAQERFPEMSSSAPSSRDARPLRQECSSEISTSAPSSRITRPPQGPLKGSSSKKLPDIPLSYTSLSELERCGYRYYLERVLHLPQQHSEGSGGRVRGRIVHCLLQGLDFAAPLVGEGDVARVAGEMGVSLGGAQLREILGLVLGLADTDLARRLARAPLLHREHPFAFASPSLVTGVFDLLVPGEDCLVVDYKSDRVDAHEDLPAFVQRHYAAQRLVYALAALHHGAARVEVIHWFLARPHEWVASVFSASDLGRLQEELDARADRVRRSGFAVSRSPHRELCLACPGRGTLCSWDASLTLRPHPSLPS